MKIIVNLIILFLFSISLNSDVLMVTKKWMFKTGYDIYSSPAIGINNTVYIGSKDNKLYAINSETGEKVWEFQTEGDIISSPAIGKYYNIYIGSYDGKLYSITPEGKKRWEFKTGDWIGSTPAIGPDNTIYIQSQDGKLYAINDNGEKKWEFKTKRMSDATPVIGVDGTIYIGGEGLYAINPDGSRKWAFSTSSDIKSSPAIGAEGTIYVSDCWYLYAVSPFGFPKWEVNIVQGISIFNIDLGCSSPVVDKDGTIYIGSHNNKLYAINPDGTIKWEFETGGPIESTPLIGTGKAVYVGSEDGKFYAVDKDSGRKLWEFKTEGKILSSPTVSQAGVIYFGSTDGNLYAINSSSTSRFSDFPWPMFQNNSLHTGRIDSKFSYTYANPETSLNAMLLTLNYIKNPEDTVVKVTPDKNVYIEPFLQVLQYDVGRDAELFIYAYIPSLNYWYKFPTVKTTLKYFQFFSNYTEPINFGGLAGLKIYIYYGYKINEAIKYNDYTIEVEKK